MTKSRPVRTSWSITSLIVNGKGNLQLLSPTIRSDLYHLLFLSPFHSICSTKTCFSSDHLPQVRVRRHQRQITQADQYEKDKPKETEPKALREGSEADDERKRWCWRPKRGPSQSATSQARIETARRSSIESARRSSIEKARRSIRRIWRWFS